MSLTLVATFNTKDDANRAVEALVGSGWDRKTVSTTVRRELSTQLAHSHTLGEADSFKAVALVAMIGAIIGAAIGIMLALGTWGFRIEVFHGNALLGFIAGAVSGLAIGTYSGAVASVRKTRDQRFEVLSPPLSAKERVMVSMTVSDERQESVSRLLRKYGAYAVREWSLIGLKSARHL